jgi:hypothetical protein
MCWHGGRVLCYNCANIPCGHEGKPKFVAFYIRLAIMVYAKVHRFTSKLKNSKSVEYRDAIKSKETRQG